MLQWKFKNDTELSNSEEIIIFHLEGWTWHSIFFPLKIFSKIKIIQKSFSDLNRFIPRREEVPIKILSPILYASKTFILIILIYISYFLLLFKSCNLNAWLVLFSSYSWCKIRHILLYTSLEGLWVDLATGHYKISSNQELSVLNNSNPRSPSSQFTKYKYSPSAIHTERSEFYAKSLGN